ncbi:MAG: SUF system Fe-S cluster assembly regulator [Bdellovibrionales bacterium]
MLRLGRLTDYAVTLLSHMGKEKGGTLWAASGLAEKSGLPMPTVAKVLKLLAKSNMISAQRGATGGYKLARHASEISIAEIIEAMDGPIAITDCSHGSAHENCKIHHLCPMSNGWNKVNVAVRGALEDVSLAEMFELPFLFETNDASSKRKL